MLSISRAGTELRRIPPVEVADEVQLWARQNSRRFGRVEWHPILNCWVIHFGLKSDAPNLRAWQEGTLDTEPTESVMLNEWDPAKKAHVAISLEDLGAAGIRELLERADMSTGRGETQSIQEGIARTRQHNAEQKERNRNLAGEAGRELAWLTEKRLKGEPVITPGIDLKEN